MRRLGQNFLTAKAIARSIAEAADIQLDDVILEIGPGRGILTEAILVKSPRRLIAIEKDSKLAEFVRGKFYSSENLEVISADVLGFLRNSNFQITNPKQIQNPKSKIENAGYKVVANIPYYITSHLLRLIFSQKNLPARVVFPCIHRVTGEGSPGFSEI